MNIVILTAHTDDSNMILRTISNHLTGYSLSLQIFVTNWLVKSCSPYSYWFWQWQITIRNANFLNYVHCLPF